jgi:excisionase family DNA binding protein
MLKPEASDPATRPVRDVMTVYEVAELLGVAPVTIYRHASRGAIPHRRLGTKILFSREAIMVWLAGPPIRTRS